MKNKEMIVKNYTDSSFHCDHILPRNAGGKAELANLAWSCPWCNTHKHTKTHARDPQTDRHVPLFNPRLKKWKRHFMWSESLLYIIGRTRSGRATVDALNMNRVEHVNRRRLLQFAGEHPPYCLSTLFPLLPIRNSSAIRAS